jgi:hypothetical protein
MNTEITQKMLLARIHILQKSLKEFIDKPIEDNQIYLNNLKHASITHYQSLRKDIMLYNTMRLNHIEEKNIYQRKNQRDFTRSRRRKVRGRPGDAGRTRIQNVQSNVAHKEALDVAHVHGKRLICADVLRWNVSEQGLGREPWCQLGVQVCKAFREALQKKVSVLA